MINEIKQLIHKSQKITVLSGAGMSTESGILDFRSPGGVWSKYKAVTIQEFMTDPQKRIYYWKYKAETIPSMLQAKPNAAHQAIAKLDKQNKLFWLLTQNIDGLHAAAGVQKEKIIRLHGTNREVICLSCGKVDHIQMALDMIEGGIDVPLCTSCQGFLKPNTVSFGQSLDPNHLAIAQEASSECDLFMALGSSLQVYPACGYVEVAHKQDIPIIIINRDATPYDMVTPYIFPDSLSVILSQLV